MVPIDRNNSRNWNSFRETDETALKMYSYCEVMSDYDCALLRAEI